VYAGAGLAVVPPPLRDDPRWLDEAARGVLPDLIRAADLHGTIHNHTTASDGAHTLREMCEAARERGLSYFGVCDHSQSLQVANGLSPDRLRAQIDEVAALNADYAARGIDFRVFSGSEVDILADGSLDYPDDLLSRLDVVVASVHTGFSMTEDQATDRIVRAVQNPHVDVLGHATGRLLLRRQGYPLDHLAVLDACAAHGVAVELNANPWRLDMDWAWIPEAVARGVRVSINPDAHAAEGLDDTRWGVASAQKGGLTAAGSLTSLDAGALATWLHDRNGRG
jgi:DNA polymerase (family 10)